MNTQLNEPVVRRFKLSAIHPGANARTEFDQAKLNELAESLKDTRGTLQPLLGTLRADGEVDLIAGERRLRAAELACLEELEVKLVDCPSKKDWLKWNLVENMQREDLKPLEKANRVHEMLALTDEQTGILVYNRASLAAELGVNPQTITRYENLLQASPKLQNAVNEEGVDMETAALIGALPKVLHAQAEKDIVFRSWGGPMDREAAKKHIAERYRRDLRKGQFDRTSADLVPDAGPCAACPFFGANREDVDGKSRGYTCLNPECFDRKQQAHVNLVARLAEQEGTKVLGQTSTSRIFQDWNNEVSPSSGYVDIKDAPDAYLLKDAAAKAPKWEKILTGTCAPVVVAIDKEGRARRLVEVKVAVEAAKASAHGELFKAKAGDDLDTFDEKKHQAQITKAKNKVTEATLIEGCMEMLQSFSQPWNRDVRLAFLEQIMNGGHTQEDAELLCKILNLEVKGVSDWWKKLKELVDATLTRDDQLDGFLLLAKNIRSIRYNGFYHIKESMKDYCVWAGFDAKAWHTKMDARVKDAEKEAKKAIRAKLKLAEKPKVEVPEPKAAKSAKPEAAVDENREGMKQLCREWKAANPGHGVAAVADGLMIPYDVAAELCDELIDEKAPAEMTFEEQVGALVVGTHKIADLIGKTPKKDAPDWDAKRVKLIKAVAKVESNINTLCDPKPQPAKNSAKKALNKIKKAA